MYWSEVIATKESGFPEGLKSEELFKPFLVDLLIRRFLVSEMRSFGVVGERERGRQQKTEHADQEFPKQSPSTGLGAELTRQLNSFSKTASAGRSVL